MTSRIRNPWRDLPDEAPHVLDIDRPHVEAFNATVKNTQRRLLTHVLPEPFAGDAANAGVLVLMLNPGFAGSERRWHDKPEYAEAMRANIQGRPRQYPLIHLDPRWSQSPGGKWARARLRVLTERVGLEVVAENLAFVDFHGYHSRSFQPIPVTLPSQAFGFDVVRRAIGRCAVIVVGRGADAWMTAVPELLTYENTFENKNPRSLYITPGMLGGRAFRSIVSALGDRR